MLKEGLSFFNDLFKASTVEPKKDHVTDRKEPLCIGHLKGQDNTKRGLLIAAAGRHNVLLVGPPGEGKSTIVSTMPGFLPNMNRKEYDDYRYICDDSNTNGSNWNTPNGLIRPFIEVGPTITESGLIGGGRKPIPGAISLAHSGILFMDEFPQYDRGLLESLRTPIERKEVLISRNGEHKLYPCNFQLIGAMNPCPCGYGGTLCSCSPAQIQRYLHKLSGPMLDRIDLFLYMNRTSASDKFAPYIEGQSQQFKVKVENAILFRLNDRGQEYFNKDIHSKEVFNANSNVLNWGTSGLSVFKMYLDRKYFTTRKGVRLARLSRTIADLLGHSKIESKHLYMIDEYLFLPGNLNL